MSNSARRYPLSIFASLLMLSCGDNAGTLDGPASQPARDAPDAPQRGPLATLFVGNSYIFVNDVTGHFRNLVGDAAATSGTVEVTTGGYRLAQHAADARTDGTALARWLRTGTPIETAFAALVLQEQSQIGGLPNRYAERGASIAAALELAILAKAKGVPVVLYATWGRRHGDPENELYYRSFVTMQNRLDTNYTGLAALLRSNAIDVRVAPVGVGFRTVYEDVARLGGDPTIDGTAFAQLFESDGSHPSVQGAYLAACIIAGTITQADVTGFIDEPALGSAISQRLRAVCQRALRDPRGDVPTVVYPRQKVHAAPGVNGFFGEQVAISADANQLLINGTEPAFLQRTDAGWLVVQTLASGRLGSAMSADGNWAMAGAPVQLYARNGAAWSPFLSLSSNGTSVALDATATHMIESSGQLGQIFARINNGWMAEAMFGPIATVALDAAGQRCAMGGKSAAPARIYARNGSQWSEEMATTLGASVVAIAGDGQTVLAAAPALDRIEFLRRTGTGWQLTQAVDLSDYSSHGAALALNTDGSWAAVGTPRDSSTITGVTSGSVQLYHLEDGVFRLRYLLVPDVASSQDVPLFGEAVAISGDGRVVVVGAPNRDVGEARYAGEASIFVLPSGP